MTALLPRSAVTAMALAAIGVVGAVLPLAAHPATAAASTTVAVRAGAFSPFEAAVDQRGTVTWSVEEPGHSVVADDERFAFRGPGGTLAAGTSVSFTFGSTDEVVRYYCDVHGGPGGQGMAGVVVVGSPPPPPPPPSPVIAVPADQPTLEAAVAVAAPGHRIELAPGPHAVAETVTVAVDRLTIAGQPGARLVPVAGRGGFPASALELTGAHVRVEGLVVEGFRTAGIRVSGAEAAAIVGVTVDGLNFTLDGIDAVGVTGLVVRDTTLEANRRAGLRVAACLACGALVDGTDSRRNDIGLLFEAAAGVVVRDTSVVGNRSGIVGHRDRARHPLGALSITVTDSTVAGNEAAGIRLAGPTDSLVRRSDLTGNGRSLVVAGDWAQRTTVRSNRVDGTDDLAWDGVGRHVVFADNVDAAGRPVGATLDPTGGVQ